MVDDKLEEISVRNERSLQQQLAWAIEASVGQFKLILARCNYASSRSRPIQRLREICQVKIRVLVLKESERTLYTAIREEFRDDVQALMILGLESVRNLDQMLITANQVREEFRKNFPFPVVLWIDDEVHKKLMQFAPDLESWATTKHFAIPPNELIEFLQETAEQLLTGRFNLTLERCWEIKLAWQDLQNAGQVLEAEAKARIQYLLGLTEYIDNRLDNDLEYYQESLAFWQQVNDLVWQGKVLSDITLCYYEKARQNETNGLQHRSETIDKFTQAGLVTVVPPSRISETDWQQTRNYLQQSLQVFETAQRPDLVAHLLDKLGVILRDLQDWEQLKTLAEQSLSIHEAEGNSLKISQDYGFLAEVALANQKWRDAKKLAEKALEVLATENSSQTRSLELYKQSLPPQANESAQADFVCVAAISNRQKFLFLLAQAEQNLDEEQEARSHLEAARKIGVADHKPQLYLNILSHL